MKTMILAFVILFLLGMPTMVGQLIRAAVFAPFVTIQTITVTEYDYYVERWHW